MLAVRLPQSLEKELINYSKNNNISKSKAVKEALELYLKQKQNKTPYELGENIFGKYSSRRDDLSTTYKQKIKEKIGAKR